MDARRFCAHEPAGVRWSQEAAESDHKLGSTAEMVAMLTAADTVGPLTEPAPAVISPISFARCEFCGRHWVVGGENPAVVWQQLTELLVEGFLTRRRDDAAKA